MNYVEVKWHRKILIYIMGVKRVVALPELLSLILIFEQNNAKGSILTNRNLALSSFCHEDFFKPCIATWSKGKHDNRSRSWIYNLLKWRWLRWVIFELNIELLNIDHWSIKARDWGRYLADGCLYQCQREENKLFLINTR